MVDRITYVGLDVHKESITVAVGVGGAAAAANAVRAVQVRTARRGAAMPQDRRDGVTADDIELGAGLGSADIGQLAARIDV